MRGGERRVEFEEVPGALLRRSKRVRGDSHNPEDFLIASPRVAVGGAAASVAVHDGVYGLVVRGEIVRARDGVGGGAPGSGDKRGHLDEPREAIGALGVEGGGPQEPAEGGGDGIGNFGLLAME